MAGEEHSPDLNMDPESLYQEEMFTDHRVGTIQRLSPVTRDGGPDQTRKVRYVGQTQLMTSAGPLPISFEIEADSLGDAASKFGENAKKAVEDTMERIKEMRREAASGLIVPGSGQGGAPGGGLQIP